jgi:hypothetical protein
MPVRAGAESSADRLRGYHQAATLGALIPQRVENLLPANKNLGTTHITNGCYRRHPVEWNIGESAGALAACCLDHGVSPGAVRNTPGLLTDF